MMSETTGHYPVASLHRFLEEASDEFRRYRFQATVNFVGSIVLLALVARFVIFLSVTYTSAPPHMRLQGPFILDSVLLLAALAAVLWSFDVWRHQRRFVSRWGERFEKLQAMESKLMPEA